MRLAARAGSPRWSVRLLDTFDDPEVRAFAGLVDTARPGATRMIAACDDWLREQGSRTTPLPLQVLDEDAQPALLLPLLLRKRKNLRLVLPARWRPAPDALSRAALPISRPGLALSRLESRAILRAIVVRLPPADLLATPLLHPHVLPLSWRGLVHLLSLRLRGEKARG